MNLVLKVSQSPCTGSRKRLCPENGPFELFYSGFTLLFELCLISAKLVIPDVTKRESTC